MLSQNEWNSEFSSSSFSTYKSKNLPIPLNTQFCLSMTENVTEINMEKLAIFSQHDIVIMPILFSKILYFSKFSQP